jgi:DNA-binding Lrp family transcriptional regulator
MIPDAPISTLRLALRTANAFIVEMLTACRVGRDFTDALILATLGQCNSAPIAGDVALQRRYGAFETPAPESLRRPISINAIAVSLGLPFETVRRRVKRLIAEGLCEMVPEGVRLRQASLDAEQHRCALEEVYQLVRNLYLRFKQSGCLDLMALPAEAGAPWTGESPPVRIVWRVACDYVLRMMEHLLPNVSNLTRGFIALAVVRANTESLSDNLRGADGADAAAFPPNHLRRPAKASEIAAVLGLPHETVRRHLAALIDEGLCERAREGVIVPVSVLARQNVLIAWDANFRDLARMFAELSDTGVLALWDELAAGQSAA